MAKPYERCKCALTGDDRRCTLKHDDDCPVFACDCSGTCKLLPAPTAVCWEYQAGQQPIRLPFSIYVF